MRKFALLITACFIAIQSYGQTYLDDLNVYFKQDFENNTLGKYVYSEFQADWLYPTWNSRQSTTQMVQDKANVNNSSKTLQVFYPANSLGPQEGGAQWWSQINNTQDEMYLSYDLMYMPDFKFQKGGKLPSMKSGDVDAGNKPTGYDGFTAGLSFNINGQVRFYIYYPDQPSTYGQTITWGSKYALNPFPPSKLEVNYTSGSPVKTEPGKWHNITYRVVLNTIKSTGGGNYDGILEAYFDGKLVSQISKILFRHTKDLKLDWLRMYTMFGGSTEDFRNPCAEWTKFDNFLLYNYKSGINVPRGRTLSPTTRTINYWRKFSASSTSPTIGENTAPVIKNQTLTASESSIINNLVGKIAATDVDQSQTLKYSITSGNEAGLFQINSSTGEISAIGTGIFKPGVINSYILKVTVTDNGNPVKSASADVTLNLTAETIIQVQNAVPVINDQSFTVNETSFTSNVIGKIVATDPDAGQKISFSITEGNESEDYTINKLTGELSADKTIFGPGICKKILTIKVIDDALQPLSNTASVTITAKGNSKTVYIDPDNKNDAMANGSVFHPYATWQQITWQEGYTYLQKRNTFTEADKLVIGANNVNLGAYGDGELPIISSTTNTYLVSGFEKSGVKIQNLNLQASNAVSCVYFLGSTSDSIIVDHCILTGNSTAIKIVDAKAFISKYNRINSESEGISSSANSNDIYYNIFEKCNTAVNVTSNQSKAKVYNNVFVNNKQSLSLSYADLTLYNNIFYMSATGQKALTHGTGKLLSDHNIFYPEQAGFITIANSDFNKLDELQKAMKVDMNSFNSDPQFEDMFTKNFSLRSSSPGINHGENLNSEFDFIGNKVPLFGVTDIGSFEFSGGIMNQQPVESSSIKIYPNPSSGKVNVSARLIQDPKDQSVKVNSELRVLDVTGKIVFAKNLQSESIEEMGTNIDLTNFNNGLYFVVLQVANEIIKEKLILNK